MQGGVSGGGAQEAAQEAWSDLARPPLRVQELRRALVEGPAPAWRALDVLASTGSTNADLAERARNGEPEGLVVLADHQHAGRGRLTRSWEAPPRASLACSVLLRPGTVGADGAPAVDPRHWSWLSMIGGLAVVDALTRVCGLPARLKWPNDVLVPGPGSVGADDPATDHLKVCGVLAEVVPGGAVVLGTGINVTQDGAELPVPGATSLWMAGAAATDRSTVAKAYLRALSSRYRDWRRAEGDPLRSGVAAAYREACRTIGRQVRVHLPGEQVLEGVAEEVDAEGRLVVRDPAGGLTALAAGDVVHVRAPDHGFG
ncbi:MAG: biotin--[acetyl-CoA-carboxylase] ligase [Actinomycetales bacterium]|nr:biotin--[acetyl-CoA-carboxylase] ligase [Actinomycetales bacterium]